MTDIDKSKMTAILLSKNKHPLWAKKLVRIALWIAYSGYKIKGIENIPTKGPLIIASTHLSYLDPIILSAFIPRDLFYFAKKELFRNFVFSKLITKFGAISIDREGFTRRSFEVGNKILESQKCIVIFPEGGILQERKELKIKPGLGMMSTLNNTPILPVAIKGSDTLFNLKTFLTDRIKLSLNFGELIIPEKSEIFSKIQRRERIISIVTKKLAKLEKEKI